MPIFEYKCKEAEEPSSGEGAKSPLPFRIPRTVKAFLHILRSCEGCFPRSGSFRGFVLYRLFRRPLLHVQVTARKAAGVR